METAKMKKKIWENNWDRLTSQKWGSQSTAENYVILRLTERELSTQAMSYSELRRSFRKQNIVLINKYIYVVLPR